MDKWPYASKVWDVITDPFPNLNNETVEVKEWIIYFIPYLMMDLITYPYWNLIQFMLVKESRVL